MTQPSRRRVNRLAQETSPYLLQHAENPVDWHPWGSEALELAKSSNRPILLSIGYAACHWCHVMERESFEDEAIAALMNEHFVCVKVDREERPDLDEIYMAATVSMNGSGGWPMTVFLTPDQRPFFAGTYFPPDDRYGRPGFKRLLVEIAKAWGQDSGALAGQADLLTRAIREQSRAAEPLSVGRDAMASACEALWQAFDRRHGGFGRAPKFPPAQTLSFLLRYTRDSADLRALEMVVGTLNGMKNGGMYDHLGGGFSRYSTDERWLVPHFEKMLYDNAGLAQVYLEAYLVTGRDEYARVASETLDYVVREMQGPEGGYFTATDADSEGVEGKYFVWTPDQIDEVLDSPDAERFCAFYDITPQGNWEGNSVLNTPRSLEEVAHDLGIQPAELAESLERAKPQVFEARQRRVPPLLDDKVLTAHNGLMIGAMAFGYEVLAEPAYLRSASRASDYLWERMRRPDGGLFRTARAGVAHLDAYLEDYAYLSDALVTLYEAGGKPAELDRAMALAERLLADFSDEAGGAFYHTAHTHEPLIARTREGSDGALPNPNSIAARALLRLGRHSGRQYLSERAAGAIMAYGRQIARLPRAFASALSAVDLALEPGVELVIVGAPGDPRTRELARVAADLYLPNKVQAYVDPSDPRSRDLTPLTRDKQLVEGRPAAYVCENFSCQAPVTRPEELRSALERAEERRRLDRGSELGRSRLPGRASAEGTRRASEAARAPGQPALRPNDYRELADTGIRVSRLGFGAYRLQANLPEHARALESALEHGVNLIDTASSYTDGDSERVIGQSLSALVERGRLKRNAIVLVTKVGYAQGFTLQECRVREQQGRGFPETVKVSDELWHSVHPSFLDQEIGRSLARLQVGTVDVCLLHNPEYFFEAPPQGSLLEVRQEFYRRMEQAFRWLESAVESGRIGYYGVSSNALVRPADDARAIDAAALLASAERAASKQHHFKVLECPLNLLEPAAASLENTHGGALTLLDFAQRERLAVLTNRPLNAFVHEGMLRLVDPDEALEIPSLTAQLEPLRKLEARFVDELSAQIRVPDGAVPAAALFRWATHLEELAPRVVSLAQYEEIERVVLVPRVEEAVRSLNQAFGSRHPGWSEWRDAYLVQLRDAMAALRGHAAGRTRHELGELRAALRPFAGDGERLEAFERATFSQLALAAVGQIAGVSSVLVGMRREAYIQDALTSLSLTPLDEPRSAFAALRAKSRGTAPNARDQTADQGKAP